MSPFEFFLSLFGLLLGLSLAEVMGGLARTLNARTRVRIGWLTPLLGINVLLNLTSFWMIAWYCRDVIPPHWLSILFGLIVTGIYYITSTIVFPQQSVEWPEGLDQHFDRHKRQVVAGMAACTFLARGAQALLGITPRPDQQVMFLVVAVVFYGLIVLLWIIRSRRGNLVALIALAVFQIVITAHTDEVYRNRSDHLASASVAISNRA